MPDVASRLHEIDAWQELPDFAFVNWHEDGADEVATKLLERGVGVKAGIWHEQGLRAWAVSPIRSRCLRVLVEVQDMTLDDKRRVGRSLVDAVHTIEPQLSFLLHGEECSTWAAIELAGLLGLDTRAGFEDYLTLSNGLPTRGNANLVQSTLSVYTNRLV